MLNSSLFATYKSQYEYTINTLGVQSVWTKAKPPGTTKTITVGSRIASNKDEALVNAYGIGALVFTLKASDFVGDAPEKFDTLAVGSETYTIDHVAPVHLNLQVVGYRCYVRGK